MSVSYLVNCAEPRKLLITTLWGAFAKFYSKAVLKLTKLIIIRGIPGAGKSRLANTLLECGVVQYVAEADQFFVDSDGIYKFDSTKLASVHAECQCMVVESLANGNSVAVANTLTTEAEVAVYESIAKMYDAEFVSIIVENRHDGNNVHNVPRSTLERMRTRFSIKL